MAVQSALRARASTSSRLRSKSSRVGVSRVALRRPLSPSTPSPSSNVACRASSAGEPTPKIEQVNQPINGDPFIAMMETPVTSSPAVANYLNNLPAYRIAVSPLLRGAEIGLAHGFLLVGPFIKLGPLRNTEVADLAGCLSGAGLVIILTACLAIYGVASFQDGPGGGEAMSRGGTPKPGFPAPPNGKAYTAAPPKKTLSGRPIMDDPAKTAKGWSEFTAGFAFGGLSGVMWAYICTLILPFYNYPFWTY